MSIVRFEQVESAQQKQEAGALIREYLEWLNDILESEYDIAFDVKAMLQSDLVDQQKFHPPYGRFYIVRRNGLPAGVGCLKQLSSGVGEVKRMYVPPAFRGKGIARAIVNRLIDDARKMGYQQLRIESLEFLSPALSLYRSVGFHEIEPYANNSMESFQPPEQLDRYYPITVFMEMDL